MDYQLYKNIISDLNICNGKPVIKNRRITVQSVIGFVLSGENDEEILKSFPRLQKEDIETCKQFTSLLFEKPTVIQPLKVAR